MNENAPSTLTVGKLALEGFLTKAGIICFLKEFGHHGCNICSAVVITLKFLL